MKFTVAFITVITISTTWAIKTKVEDPKDKREASIGYPSSGHSNQAYSFQSPTQGHEDASSVSIGAGYSVGGAKPGYSFGNQISGAAYQIPSEGLPASGHAAIQLAPITLQPSHGSLVSNDLSQLMSQLSQGINSGALTLNSPTNHGAVYQFGGQSAQGGHELAFPQFSYNAPKLQQYNFGDQAQPAVPSYASGTKGLGSYSSTGPVLFSPEAYSNQVSQNYGSPSGGHSISEGASVSYGESGQSYPGQSYSLGSLGHSLGGALKAYGGNYATPGKSSFKPSAFLGSVQNEGGNALSGSYAAPSFGSYQNGGLSLGSVGHGSSFGGSLSGLGGGSSKYVSQNYLPAKSEGVGSLESIASAFSASGQSAHSPQGSNYGFPSSAYSSSNLHSASAPNPQYYVTSTKHSSGGGFGSGSAQYKGPISGHSSLNSYSTGPKYSFGGQSNTRYVSPKDSHGAYSETSYNTIKYSEELKPRIH